MNVFHLPGAIVGDPRCNCVMCERNRPRYAEHLKRMEQEFGTPDAPTYGQVKIVGPAVELDPPILCPGNYDNEDLPSLEDLGEQEVESDELMKVD